jgi:heme-degrading monooxygenase HmoA
MYIAMNHFRVDAAKGEEFEGNWRERETYLKDVPGFQTFHLLRGPVEGDARVYASHSVWQDEESFRSWVGSESFRKAHSQGRSTVSLLLGPPQLMCWQSVDL